MHLQKLVLVPWSRSRAEVGMVHIAKSYFSVFGVSRWVLRFARNRWFSCGSNMNRTTIKAEEESSISMIYSIAKCILILHLPNVSSNSNRACKPWWTFTRGWECQRQPNGYADGKATKAIFQMLGLYDASYAYVDLCDALNSWESSRYVYFGTTFYHSDWNCKVCKIKIIEGCGERLARVYPNAKERNRHRESNSFFVRQ